MATSLERKVSRAKAAQAKRIGTATKKKKRCTKGKSCGFSCISGSKTCLVDLPSGLSTDIRQTVGEIQDRPRGTEEARSREGGDLSSQLSQHLKENTFKIPSKSFGGEQLANMLNQAADDLDGEARENINKLREFIVKDKTGVFVSETKDTFISRNGGDKGAKESARNWAFSKEYLDLLTRTYGENVGMNFIQMKDELEGRIKSLKDRLSSLSRAIRDAEAAGIDTTSDKATVRRLQALLKADRSRLSDMPMALARYSLGNSASDGWTMAMARFITLHEDRELFHELYSSRRGLNAKALQESIEATMTRRANASRANDADIVYGTFHFSGGYGYNKYAPSVRNEQILATFAHEMGHQIHYRGGQPSSPPNLPSMSVSRIARGITEYATVNDKELFAEAFVAYTFNPAALRRQDPALYRWVDSTVQSAMDKAGSPISFSIT